jgi:hypothetical protein
MKSRYYHTGRYGDKITWWEIIHTPQHRCGRYDEHQNIPASLMQSKTPRIKLKQFSNLHPDRFKIMAPKRGYPVWKPLGCNIPRPFTQKPHIANNQKTLSSSYEFGTSISSHNLSISHEFETSISKQYTYPQSSCLFLKVLSAEVRQIIYTYVFALWRPMIHIDYHDYGPSPLFQFISHICFRNQSKCQIDGHQFLAENKSARRWNRTLALSLTCRQL